MSDALEEFGYVPTRSMYIVELERHQALLLVDAAHAQAETKISAEESRKLIDAANYLTNQVYP